MRDETRSKALRLLIVDDCPDTTFALSLLVREWGFEASVANNGAEALRLTRLAVPDAVFLDIGMPEMSGWELVPRLRAQWGAQPVHVVTISGYGEVVDEARSRELGCELHLVKPVEPAFLRQLLTKWHVEGPSLCHRNH